MILDKKVKILLNPSNLKRYKKLNYEGGIKDEIEIDVKDLSNGSHVLINVRCDECGVEKKVEYCNLIMNGYIDKYFCRNCKNKQNLKIKYGVTNVFQIKSVKEKIKNTNLEKYGVDNISKSSDIKEKKRKTCYKNFGVSQPLSSEIIKNKSKETLLNKYGVDNVSKSDDIKKKKEETCLKNNGVKYISQSKIFKEKIKSRNLKILNEKYSIIDYDDVDYIIHCEKCNRDFNINKKSYKTRKEYDVDLCTYCNPIGTDYSNILLKTINQKKL